MDETEVEMSEKKLAFSNEKDKSAEYSINDLMC
jgi:hypothetical protein